MTLALPGAPFPITYRELWLPPGINENASLPTSIEGGHGLTLTGARKGTTVDGVHFTGAVTSNINCGAIHNAAAKLYISFRFKLDQPFAPGSPTQRLWAKLIDGDNRIRIFLDTGTGKLWFGLRTAATTRFNIAAQDGGADIDSWEAGRWYHVLASISDTVGIGRFIVDNGTIVLTNDVNPVQNGGDFVIGDEDDPGGGSGFEGVIADVFCEEGVDLTATQEEDLYRGIPPVTVDNEWLLDEGRGPTAYDRGADGNNGALDAAGLAAVPPTLGWSWGRVKQPVISFDGINDHGQSSAGVDVSGAVTIVWAGKLKAIYDGVSDDHYLVEYFIDNTNHYQINYNLITGDMRFLCVAAGTSVFADLTAFPIVIDDYAIFIGTVTAGGVIKLFANGILHETGIGLPAIAGGGMTAYIGAEDTPAYWDVSKPLLVGLIDGAFTDKQVLAYSRWLDRVFNLGVVK